MQTALIIIAIFAAVVLLVRFAAPTAKPKFFVPQRLPERTVENRISLLGKRCAAVERGSGINYRVVKPKRIIKAVRRATITDGGELWAEALLANAEYIEKSFSQCKKDVLFGAYVGHVGKYPRVFLLSKYIISGCGLDADRRSVLRLLSVFEEHAKLTAAERSILCGYLTFCIIGGLCAQVKLALKRDGAFFKGRRDGALGKLDLDSVADGDYVCGVVGCTAESDMNALRTVLEYNGVDVSAAEKNRREFSAKTYATVKAAVRSLKQVDALKTEMARDGTEKPSPRKYIKFFNIAIPVLIAVYAVFTCIFASRRYVALFAVASVITYAVLRIPVLAYSSESAVNIFSAMDKRVKSLFSRIKTKPAPLPQQVNAYSEAAYFGCEVEHYANTTHGNGIYVTCDNKGDITLNNKDKLKLRCYTDNASIEPSECDGAAERHRSAYFLTKGDLGFYAELIADVDHAACLFKVAATNRSASDMTVTVAATLLGDNGEAFVALFGNDGNSGCAMNTECGKSVAVPAFGSVTLYGAAVYGGSYRERVSILSSVGSDGYYRYAADRAYAFCSDIAFDAGHKYSFDNYPAERTQPRDPPPLQNIETIFEFAGGALLCSGEIELHGAVAKNRLIGGDMRFETSPSGIYDVFFRNERVLPRGERVIIVLGEGNLLWSPFSSGVVRTVHGMGYTDYICAYNGAVVRVKCRVTDCGAAEFSVDTENKTDGARDITVMFSVCTDGQEVELDDDSAYIATRDERLRISASAEVNESTAYKEGYFVRGSIDRVNGFRSGGVTPAATLSTALSLSENGVGSIKFYLHPEHVEIGAEAESAFVRQKNLGRVTLISDDEILNISYAYALYAAYNFGFLGNKEYMGREWYFILSAVKYVDHAAAKRQISELIFGRRKRDSCEFYVYLLCAAIELAEYCGDKGFAESIYNDPLVKSAVARAADNCLYGRADDARLMYIRAVMTVARRFDGAVSCEVYRKLSVAYGEGINKSVYSQSRAGTTLMRAQFMYEKGEFDRAYELLERHNIRHALLNAEFSALPCDEVSAAEYYVAVTEYLLGIKIRGKTVKLCPRLCEDAPRLEFDLRGAKRTVHVAVDGANASGVWKMRANDICYGNTDIDVSMCDNITLYKDGR